MSDWTVGIDRNNPYINPKVEPGRHPKMRWWGSDTFVVEADTEQQAVGIALGRHEALQERYRRSR